MRFSNINWLGFENIYDDKYIIQDMQKESVSVVIPIHWIVKEIIEKYDGKLPGSISNQKMNEYLKDVEEKAEIYTPFVKTRTQGGKRYLRPLKSGNS